MVLHLDSSVAKSGDPNPVGASGGAPRNASRDSSGSQDTVRVSGASSALNSFAADRSARIQQLTAAVQGGSYRVSGSAVAGAIVAHSLSTES